MTAQKYKDASCHPDRKIYAKNLCKYCYQASRYKSTNISNPVQKTNTNTEQKPEYKQESISDFNMEQYKTIPEEGININATCYCGKKDCPGSQGI